MHIAVKLRFVSDEGEILVCPGCAQLLELIGETGSVSRAAASMGLSVSKAWRLLDNAEKSGIKLLSRQQGGKGGGRSELTEDARKLIRQYKEKTELVRKYASSLEEDLP